MRRRTIAVKQGGAEHAARAAPSAWGTAEAQRVFAASFLRGTFFSADLSVGPGVPLWVGVQLGGSLAGKDSSTASSTSSSACSTRSRGGVLSGSFLAGLLGDGLLTMLPPCCASSDASGSEAAYADQI